MPRLGANTNLNRARKGCVYVKVDTIVAVIEEVFVNNRQTNQARAETRKTQIRGSASMGCASARGVKASACPYLGGPPLHTSD